MGSMEKGSLFLLLALVRYIMSSNKSINTTSHLTESSNIQCGPVPGVTVHVSNSQPEGRLHRVKQTNETLLIGNVP